VDATIHRHEDKAEIQPAESLISAPLVQPLLSMQFIEDISVRDGAVIDPRTVFYKSWKVVNDGNVAWPDNTTLVSVGGDEFVPPNSSFPVVTARPGEEIVISVPMQSPGEYGRHVAYFRLCSGNDAALFGQRLWADINIPEVPDIDTPVAVSVECQNVIAEVDEIEAAAATASSSTFQGKFVGS